MCWWLSGKPAHLPGLCLEWITRIKLNRYKMKERISRNFTWEEMTYSRVAVENGLLNEPSFEVKQAIMELVKRLLQPLRSQAVTGVRR